MISLRIYRNPPNFIVNVKKNYDEKNKQNKIEITENRLHYINRKEMLICICITAVNRKKEKESERSFILLHIKYI